MNKKPRLFPVLVAVSLFLASGPVPVAAQVMNGQLGTAAAARMNAPVRIALPGAGTAMAMPLMPAANLSVMQLAPGAPTPILNSVLSAQASNAPISARAGEDLTAFAAEAAVYAKQAPITPAAKTAAPAAADKGFVGRLLDLVHGRSTPSISFDGAREESAAVAGSMSLRKQKPLELPNGTRPDEQATVPAPDPAGLESLAPNAPSKMDLQGLLDARTNSGVTNKDLLLSRYPVVDVLVTETSDGRFVLKVQYLLKAGKIPGTFEPILKANLLGTVPELKDYADFIVFEALSKLPKKKAAVEGAIKDEVGEISPLSAVGVSVDRG